MTTSPLRGRALTQIELQTGQEGHGRTHWLAMVNRMDWQMIGLCLLVDVLFLLGLIVAHAAGLLPTHT